MINPIAALSPLDGRYAKSVEALRPIFSEYGLMRARVKVELSWLKALAAEPKITEIPAFSDFTLAEIDKVIENFSLEDAAAVKAIEATTNHDVKAIEYWLKERFAGVPEVAAASEFIHFACTSEDINNLSHALMLQEARETVILPKLAEIIEKLTGMAHDLAAVPMMSRTHGQPATPPKPTSQASQPSHKVKDSQTAKPAKPRQDDQQDERHGGYPGRAERMWPVNYAGIPIDPSANVS